MQGRKESGGREWGRLTGGTRVATRGGEERRVRAGIGAWGRPSIAGRRAVGWCGARRWEGGEEAAGPPSRPSGGRRRRKLGQRRQGKERAREKEQWAFDPKLRDGWFSSFYFFPNPFSTLSFQIQAKFYVNHIKSEYAFNILFISNINEQFW